MAPLTLVMFLEKAQPLGARIVRPIGLALLAAGLVVLLGVVGSRASDVTRATTP